MVGEIEKLLKDNKLNYKKYESTYLFVIEAKDVKWSIQYDEDGIEYCWINGDEKDGIIEYDLLHEQLTFEEFESQFDEILSDIKNYIKLIVKIQKEIDKIKSEIRESNIHNLKFSTLLEELLPTDLFN